MDKNGTVVINKRENHSYYDEEHGVIFGSLSKGTDLMEGIIHEYEKYNVTSGAVTCMGSLSEATYVYIKDDEQGNLDYSDPNVMEGPIEVLNGTGFLSKSEKGITDFHLHALFGNKKGLVFGGHILPGKNPTLVTIEFTIQVGKGIQAVREYSPELGFRVINFKREER